MRDKVFSNCIDLVSCPVLSTFCGKRKRKNTPLLHSAHCYNSVFTARKSLPAVPAIPALHSRLKISYGAVGGWLWSGPCQAEQGCSALFLTLHLQLDNTKTSISLVRDQEKLGGDSHLTEKLHLHLLLQEHHWQTSVPCSCSQPLALTGNFQTRLVFPQG